MYKKATIFTALFSLLLGLLTACGGATPTSSAVNVPNVKSSGTATATTGSGAYPAANPAQNQSAYPAANGAQAAPTQPAYPAAAAAPLTVVKTDGTSASLSPGDLAKIPTKGMTVGTQNVTGIPVQSILANAGITDFKQITFVGANGSQTLTKDKVDGNVILMINPDGSLQLVSPNLAEDQWLKSVNTIKAE